MHEWPILVISSGARDLAFSATCEEKISRLGLEMTIATQSQRERELLGRQSTRSSQSPHFLPSPFLGRGKGEGPFLGSAGERKIQESLRRKSFLFRKSKISSDRAADHGWIRRVTAGGGLISLTKGIGSSSIFTGSILTAELPVRPSIQ
jgi:hypothetical protein